MYFLKGILAKWKTFKKQKIDQKKRKTTKNTVNNHNGIVLMNSKRQSIKLSQFSQETYNHFQMPKQHIVRSQKNISSKTLNQDDNGSMKEQKFIRRLFQTIKSRPQIISFNPQNPTQLIIHSWNDLLNLFSLHQKASFVRQLNKYGFRKINKDAKTQIYAHPIFVEGNQSQYHTIQPRSNSEKSSQTQEWKKQYDQIMAEIFSKDPQSYQIVSLLGEIMQEFQCIKEGLRDCMKNIHANSKHNSYVRIMENLKRVLIDMKGSKNNYENCYEELKRNKSEIVEKSNAKVSKNTLQSFLSISNFLALASHNDEKKNAIQQEEENSFEQGMRQQEKQRNSNIFGGWKLCNQPFINNH